MAEGWSRAGATECAWCGRDDRKHAARGLCVACIRRKGPPSERSTVPDSSEAGHADGQDDDGSSVLGIDDYWRPASPALTSTERTPGSVDPPSPTPGSSEFLHDT